jgi:hypothetical protein
MSEQDKPWTQAAETPRAVDRRDFLKGTLVAGTAAATASMPAVSAYAQPGRVPGTTNHYQVPATDKTVHGFSYANYLAELGADAQSKIYEKSSVDLAMRDAFKKMRHFLMTTKALSEDEAISLMSVAVDFGITQVVDDNWGVHAIIKKSLFAGAA